MNCEMAHERIVMAEYGELPDDAAHELERHLAICPDCGREREAVRLLKELAIAHPVTDPDANLIARSRLRLEEALDALPPKRWYQRVGERMSNSFARLVTAPAAACLMLAIGAGAGGLGGYYVAQQRVQTHLAVAAVAAPAPVLATAPAGLDSPLDYTEVSTISSIVRQPNSEQVEVHFNQVVPRQMNGTLDDPKIRALLMLASERSSAGEVGDDSADLLAGECRQHHSCSSEGMRDALMMVLRYRRNADVRLKALEGLGPYVADDVRVRDAVLEALLNDSDTQVRSEAISLLEPVEADTSVREALHLVSGSDTDPQIRLASRQALSHAPEIQ